MHQEAGYAAQHPARPAPWLVRERQILVIQPQRDSHINGKKPHIARETVKHSPNQCLLTRETCHLTIGRIAEICQHQQHHTHHIMRHILIIKHAACTHTQEDGKDGDGVGVNAQLVPKQCKHQADGAREMHIQPLFGIV